MLLAGVQFDPTISLGVLLQLAGTAVIIGGALLRLERRLARLETRVEALWSRFLEP